MRRLALSVALLCAAGSLAQEPKDPPEEAGPDKLDRVSFVLDPGWHAMPVRSLAFTPAGRLVSYARDHFVRITDVATGEQTVLPVPGLPDAEKNLQPSNTDRAAVSADGTRLAVPARYPKAGGGFEHVVYVLSLPDGKVLRAIPGFKADERVQAVSVSRDGKKVAVVGADAKSEVHVWTDGSDKPVVLKRAGVRFLAFSPAEAHKDRLLVISQPRKGGELTVYDAATGLPTAGPVADERPHYSPAWSADGQWLATARSGTTAIQVWTADLKLVRTIEGIGAAVTGQAFSPTADRLLAALHPGTHAHQAAVFDLATGERKVEVTGNGLAKRVVIGSVAAAWAPTGDTVATGGGRGGDASTLVWDATTGKLARDLHSREWQFSGAGLTRAAWSPDGKAVAWKNRPPTPSFNFADLELVKPLTKERFVGPIHEADGATLDNPQGSGKSYLVDGGKKGPAFNTTYTPPWSFLRADSADRAVIGNRVYDTRAGKALLKLDGVTQAVGVAASPDGRYVFIPALDQVARVYRPDREKPLLSLCVNGTDWVVWTPEGYYAASPNGERLIGWKVDNGRDRAPTYYPAEQFRARLYRPDIVKRVLEAGSVADAVILANAARPKAAGAAPRVVTSPEALLPPGVTITVDGSNLPLVTVAVTARSAVAEQKIKSLRVMVDGRRLPGGKGVIEFAVGKEPAADTREWQVELPAGRHTVSVLVRSVDDTLNFSNKVEVLAPMKASERHAIHVLSVGVSEYAMVKPNLKCAHTDADMLAAAVGAGARTGVAYNAAPPVVLKNDKATRQAVLDALDAAQKRVQPGDLFVFHFAGHGTRDAGEFFLLTHDASTANGAAVRATAVSGAELRRRLADFPCQVLVVLDACHSGQIAGMPGGSDEAARGLADADTRVAVMCAALGHETAKEENGAGVFTAALALALGRPKQAGAFYDAKTGELNVYHLQAFVYQEVVRKPEREQTPYLKMPLGHPAFTVNQLPK